MPEFQSESACQRFDLLQLENDVPPVTQCPEDLVLLRVSKFWRYAGFNEVKRA
jgi:hypothetical protein